MNCGATFIDKPMKDCTFSSWVRDQNLNLSHHLPFIFSLSSSWSRTYHSLHYLGPTVSVLSLDMRSNRTRTQCIAKVGREVGLIIWGNVVRGGQDRWWARFAAAPGDDRQWRARRSIRPSGAPLSPSFPQAHPPQLHRRSTRRSRRRCWRSRKLPSTWSSPLASPSSGPRCAAVLSQGALFRVLGFWDW